MAICGRWIVIAGLGGAMTTMAEEAHAILQRRENIRKVVLLVEGNAQ